MTPARAALVVFAVLAFAPSLAAPPGSAKAKRLAPEDPAPVSLAAPEEPKAQVAGSCAVTNACIEYQGAFEGQDVKALCATAKGSFSAAPCPTTNGIGTCAQRQPGSEDKIVTRSYAPSTVDAAREACLNQPRGIFLKGP